MSLSMAFSFIHTHTGIFESNVIYLLFICYIIKYMYIYNCEINFSASQSSSVETIVDDSLSEDSDIEGLSSSLYLF